MASLLARRKPTGKEQLAVYSFSGGTAALASDMVGLAGLKLSEFAPHTIEALRNALPGFAGVEHSVAVFLDSAEARTQKPYTATAKVRLADAGLGYNLTYKTLFARARWASAIGHQDPLVVGDGRSRFLLQAGMTF